MKDIAERTELLSLLDRYGALLTEAQRDMLNDSLALDLSLSEIAENRSISRAAADDAIKKAERKLRDYEEKIGLGKKKEELLALLDAKEYEKLEEAIHAI